MRIYDSLERVEDSGAQPYVAEDGVHESVEPVGDLGALLENIVHSLQLGVGGLQLLVHRFELFVGRLQLFVGGLQLFDGRLQLFVGGLELLVARLQLFVGGLHLLLRALQLRAERDLARDLDEGDDGAGDRRPVLEQRSKLEVETAHGAV